MNGFLERILRPAWVRVLIVLVVLAWSAFEWSNGETFWGIVTLAMAGWAVWTFFLAPPAGSAPKDR